MKRNGRVWCAENHSVAVDHEKSGFNAKTIGLTVSAHCAHQGSRISCVPTASQSGLGNRVSASHSLIQYVNYLKACDNVYSKADECFQ